MIGRRSLVWTQQINILVPEISDSEETHGRKTQIERRVHDFGGGRDVRDSSADAAPL